MIPLGTVHLHDGHRPGLRRSRSHSSPGQHLSVNESSQPKRPTHGRSQSYLVDSKPRQANTLPPTSAIATTEKHHRLHMPHKKESHYDASRRHRYTQSEVEHHNKLLRKHANTDSLPNLVAGLRAEGGKRQNQHGEASAVPAGLTRMMSSRSYRGYPTFGPGEVLQGERGIYELRRRATSDPREPGERKKTPIELDLERADRLKRQRKFTITKEDIAKRDKEIEEAEDEIRERVAEINRTSMEITRRLDYGYYNLLEKAGNLVGTIQSFQQLSSQSKQLIENFEHETGNVDHDMKTKAEKFRKHFEEREDRVGGLEQRGVEMNRKAEELGRRLENARTIIANWEKREDETRKVWDRFWASVWWTVGVIVLIIVVVISLKEWWFMGDPVKAGLSLPPAGHWNQSLQLGEGAKGGKLLKQVDLPDDVRKLLQGIEEKNNQRKHSFMRPIPVTDEQHTEEVQEDERLRRLDEL